jgi:D-alanine-D-alanine ligase-like ATP-grasp enzyme
MLSGKSSRDSRSGKTPIGASSSSAGTSAAATSSKAHSRSAKKLKKLRICVLSSSYDGADSATASVDNYWCTPQHYIKKDRQKYTFADVTMKKIDSYRTVRELVTSNKYDVFFNLCDGGRDEKRAGVDVVQALEEHNAAFTGTDSRSFEPSKIDMKLMVGSSGVTVPNFVLLDNDESLAKKCRHLKFPVIVKHLSGYASVGINKDNRCDSLDQLKTKVRAFIKEYNHALVEEFIRGREGTVLACADQSSPFGVKVFKPLMFNFLQNNDDFAYFEKKWTMECSDQAYSFLPSSDPAYPAIVEMARNAFKYIMNGVGYGRVDFRIDEESGVPYFLEINPNCGMWYAPKDGGDFADVMVEGDQHWNHERFVANAVARALKEQAARKPWYFISHDRNGRFSTRASKTVPEGKCLFGDAVHPIPVVSKALFKLGEEDPTVGCVICRGDGIHQAVALRHSCEPNMQFVHGRTLLFAAKRQISVGEELTVDYATLRDESMPHFVCSCGTQNCRSVIFPMPATPRTVEAKAMKRLLREKRLVWLKQKADREAERILKKRSSSSFSSSSSAGGASSSSSNAGSSVSSTNTSGSGSGGAGSSGSSSGSGSNSGNGSIK